MSADAKPRPERSLNLRDLVLFNLIAVIGITWVATAAKGAVIPPPGTVGIWLHETKRVGGSLSLVLLGLVVYWQVKKTS
jgi:hypothetical protein